MNLKKLMTEKGVTQMDVGRKLWSDSKENTQRMNAWKLANGKTKTIALVWIDKLCELLETDPNGLFKS